MEKEKLIETNQLTEKQKNYIKKHLMQTHII